MHRFSQLQVKFFADFWEDNLAPQVRELVKVLLSP